MWVISLVYLKPVTLLSEGPSNFNDHFDISIKVLLTDEERKIIVSKGVKDGRFTKYNI